MTELIKDVSDTAFWIAHHRSVETARTDALFKDPLAARLAGEHGKQIASAMPQSKMTGWTVVMRTLIIDGYIQEAVKQGVDLIVNLGAGLDTRPYRLDLPQALQWVEVDYPHVIEFKESKLSGEKPRCALESVPLDLANVTERQQLLTNLNTRAKKILVLTEGVVPYLDLTEAASLGRDLRAQDHILYWIADYFSPKIMKYRGHMQKRMENAPFKFNPENWVEFFAGLGWQVKEKKSFFVEAEKVKRPPPMPWMVRWIFYLKSRRMTAKRRAIFNEVAGYALLEQNEFGHD